MILGVTVRDSSRCKPFGRKPLGVNGRADFNCNDDVAPLPHCPDRQASASQEAQPKRAGRSPSQEIQVGRSKPEGPSQAGKTAKAAKADKQLHVVSYPGL